MMRMRFRRLAFSTAILLILGIALLPLLVNNQVKDNGVALTNFLPAFEAGKDWIMAMDEKNIQIYYRINSIQNIQKDLPFNNYYFLDATNYPAEIKVYNPIINEIVDNSIVIFKFSTKDLNTSCFGIYDSLGRSVGKILYYNLSRYPKPSDANMCKDFDFNQNIADYIKNNLIRTPQKTVL